MRSKDHLRLFCVTCDELIKGKKAFESNKIDLIMRNCRSLSARAAKVNKWVRCVRDKAKLCDIIIAYD